jgi:enoyl-CoA hydratase/carnithine racemase
LATDVNIIDVQPRSRIEAHGERTVSDNSLIEQTEGPIATLTLNRPEKANAIPPEWPLRMLAFFRAVAHNPAVRCVLIQANGRHFMAGGDVAHHRGRSATRRHSRFPCSHDGFPPRKRRAWVWSISWHR